MIGLGSVGSTAAIQLAKSGIGEMTFVDLISLKCTMSSDIYAA